MKHENKNYYFTSDLHFSHHNIISYCNRPFANTDVMNKELVEIWNDTVTNNDVVYILGDVAFEKDLVKLDNILMSLHGEKHIVWGNHDELIKNKLDWRKYFKTAQDLATITIPAESNNGVKQKIALCHYAMRVWDCSHRGSWQLYGHSHGGLPDDPTLLSCDIGVDCWGYAPVSMEQLNKVMSAKTINQRKS